MFKLVKLLVMVCCFVAISGLNLAVSFAQNPNFNQVLYWDNYSFSIKEDGDKLIIKPKNLAIVNRKEVHDIVGYTVNDVQIADLNDDGYPEVLVYLTNDGSGSYGNLILLLIIKCVLGILSSRFCIVPLDFFRLMYFIDNTSIHIIKIGYFIISL